MNATVFIKLEKQLSKCEKKNENQIGELQEIFNEFTIMRFALAQFSLNCIISLVHKVKSLAFLSMKELILQIK